MSKQWIKEFILYTNKVYGLDQMVKRVNDRRRSPNVKTSVIFIILLIGFVLRLESMEAFDREIKKGRFNKLVPRKQGKPSHDTLRDALCQWNLESLDVNHDQFIQKFKQNRGPQKGRIDGLRIGAIDGSELFLSKSRTCSDCLVRKNKNGEKEYFHRAVFLQKVGGDPRVIYGVDHLKPRDGSEKGEGEVTGDRRLLKTLNKRHGKLVDVLTADALYAKATFINDALDAHMDVVIRMKEERRLIMKDARATFQNRPPDVQWVERDKKGHLVKVEAWDQGDFQSWPQVKVPLRMVKMIRQTEKVKIVGGQKQAYTEVIERWVVTTCKQSEVGTKTIAKIATARWDIENNGFHDLKTYWHLDHPYVHDPTAIEAWVDILILAVNLIYSYLFMHLHHFRDWDIPLKEVIQEMKELLRWGKFQLKHLIWNTS